MCDYCHNDASLIWTCGDESKQTCQQGICHEAVRYDLTANVQVEDLY